ncbi:MAG: preprotein translocase subunit YajC [Planctomycetaceae bacterium]|jgi:preprotein translocase subunit YajC|nr:MAG: preprotein translocase subunit YajC [Planctomycetaceae bacterium]
MSFSPRQLGPSLGDAERWNGLIAQAPAAEQPALTPLQQVLQSPFLLMGGLMALFYFMVLVPEKRRKAEKATQLAGVKKNDRIVTIAGIHGVVSAVNEGNTLTIRLDENGNNKMKIDRDAVARILSDKASEE